MSVTVTATNNGMVRITGAGPSQLHAQELTALEAEKLAQEIIAAARKVRVRRSKKLGEY